MAKSLGIFQSRGLGDLIIALPIADHYHKQGWEIVWPVCEPFFDQMKLAAPWINWQSVPVDQKGLFFYETPKKIFQDLGVKDTLWLYQYLSSHPNRTNKSWFAQFKFDQYKYAAAGIPFADKWKLKDCLTRHGDREESLFQKVVKQERFMVYQSKASDLRYNINLDWVDPEIQKVEITEHTNSIFDWIKILEHAESIVLIDSVFANLVDQLNINPSAEKYYLRKWNRNIDGNPVLLGDWNFVDIGAPSNRLEIQTVNVKESNGILPGPMGLETMLSSLSNLEDAVDLLQKQLNQLVNFK